MKETQIIADFMEIKVREHYGNVFYITDEDGYVDFVDGAEVYRPDSNWNQLMPVCIKLKIDYICTDINKAYEQVIQEIKNITLEASAPV